MRDWMQSAPRKRGNLLSWREFLLICSVEVFFKWCAKCCSYKQCSLQVFIILIAGVVCFWSISDQKKVIIVSSDCSLPIMGSFGPEGGPPCKVCHQLPSVCHCDARGLVCHRCLQKDDNECWAYYLNWKYRTNPLLGDPIIMFDVAVFILGTGLNRYCQCDGCDPNWFLRGWVCYDVRLTRHDSWWQCTTQPMLC